MTPLFRKFLGMHWILFAIMALLLTAGVYSIYALLGPAGMPASVVKTLNDALNKVAQMPEVSQRLDGIYVKATTSAPNEVRQYLETEGNKWRELGKTLNIKFN